MTLTATPYSLPTAYVGDVVYPTYINLPSNSSTASNDSDVVVPVIVDPTTTAKYSNLEKVEMYAAGAIGIMALVLFVLIIIICCNSGMTAFSSTAALAGASGSTRSSNVYATPKGEEDAEDMIY